MTDSKKTKPVETVEPQSVLSVVSGIISIKNIVEACIDFVGKNPTVSNLTKTNKRDKILDLLVTDIKVDDLDALKAEFDTFVSDKRAEIEDLIRKADVPVLKL
ncbi:MAG: hypothetical protein HN975_01965 [Anaerolineae bacterium]|jgi:hypothetical protein|nr:hypothetical protein [Anaerolineae bacterium]